MTQPPQIIPTPSQERAPHELPVNDLAAAYQPRRVWAAAVNIAWNLLIAAVFIRSRLAWIMCEHLGRLPHARLAIIPLYIFIYFLGYSLLNYPLELWCGYLEERQFGLAKDGIRAWTRCWLAGVAQHCWMFVIGSSMLVILQKYAPASWLVWTAAVLLGLFLLTTYFAYDLLPRSLFSFDRADEPTMRRLNELGGGVVLPPIVFHSAPALRDYTGGLIGLGGRQILLISRSTLLGASDGVLRFILRHEAGHRHYHHLLLSALAGWAWIIAGLAISDRVISGFAFASPIYIAYLALTLSVWMAVGEPILAYIGRRLEYQADRFYLRQGGSMQEMSQALAELADRNLARTEGLRRRQRFMHPLPSIQARLFTAKLYEEKLAHQRN